MYTYVVPCLLGLEKLVGDECRRLGLQDVKVETAVCCAAARWRIAQD